MRKARIYHYINSFPLLPKSLDILRDKEASVYRLEGFMRLVITKRNRMTVLLDASGRIAQGVCDDSYRERLLKYIPAETIALFIAVYGITYYLSGSETWYPLMSRWILIAGILGTVLYLWQVEGVTDPVQLAISTTGFFLWACALGVVTVASLPYYNAVAAAVLLIIWVFVAPILEGIPERW